MALARYTHKLKVSFTELNDLFHALDIWQKLRDGRLSLHRIRSTKTGSRIDRINNTLDCQIGTLHTILDREGRMDKRFPESVIVGQVFLWREGHD